MSDNKRPSEYWKQWWNEQARTAASDFRLNRMTSVRLAKLEKRELEQFIKAVDPRHDDVILDAGCGSGRNISLLSPCVRQVTGIDYSEEMIRRAKERIIQEKLRNVQCLHGNVTAMNFPSNAFDKVICTSVLQYLNDRECSLAMQEMVRVCKPGGTLVLHVKNGTSLYGLSLALLRPIAAAFGRTMKPEFYRSRSWHFDVLKAQGGIIRDFDGFGILTFVPLPNKLVSLLLRSEVASNVPKFFRKFAVNFKMTVYIDKAATNKASHSQASI
jgi:ubiquinone/menaquinone biosynthesis C-methylase UbiE